MAANINNADLLALKSYITAADSTQYESLAASTLILDLTHSNLHQRHAEIRFDKHDTVDELRRRIHQKTGTPPHFQHLQIKSGGCILYEIIPEMESNRMLGYYNLPHGSNVHCVDVDPHSKSRGGAYEDTSLVEKFTLSEEEYNKRKGTLRDWGRQMKEKDEGFSLRKHAREHAELVEAKRLYRESGVVKEGFEVDDSGVVVRSEVEKEFEKEKEKENVGEVEFGEGTVQHLSLGARCQVQPGGRRGEIAYIGQIDELGVGGYWVGVILDEPVGKTDGSVKSGVRYFEAPGTNRGGFFRGKNVEAGNFPEIDIMDELDDSEDEL